MRLSDGLKQRKAEAIDRLEKLSQTASDERREFTADEAKQWDSGMADIRDLDGKIAREVERENLRREQPGRVAIDSEGNRHRILRSSDRLADRFPSRDGQRLDIAKAIKGIITADWTNAEYERRAMGESTLPGGGYSVPAELSATWLDLARAKAVTIAAGAGTLPMQTQALRIAEITQDVVPTYRPENAPLNETDMVFGSCDLRARLVGVVARASLELISDSPMASDMITTSITAALGLAMDQAGLSGDGLVDATHDNPTGILNAAGVNAIAVAGALTDYSHLLDAMLMIEQANLVPDATILNPVQNNELRKLPTGIAGDKTPLRQPDDYAAFPKFITTGLPSGSAIIGDFDMGMLYGLREGVVIEATRVGDTALKNAQILVRGYMRLDVGIIRPRAFTRLTGITLAQAAAAAPHHGKR